VYFQQLLVHHLRLHVSKDSANWYEMYWTDARDRYCLCHRDSTHGRTNNNLGVEVDWRDFKKICPASSTLATLIGCEYHFVEQCGMEHEAKLVEMDMPISFISEPIFPKSLWDEIPDLHQKTLACILACRP
jgi:hypothetical protein